MLVLYREINLQSVGRLELFEEPLVVLGEEPQVFHPVFEVGDTLYAHAESIAGVYFAVDAAGVEYIGVDHAATEAPDGSGRAWDKSPAAFTTAQVARDIHFGARFGKGEVGGAQPDFGLRPEHLFGKEEQRLFQVGKCNVLVDVESFDLMEKAVCAGR